MVTPAFIEVQGLHKSFGDHEVLHGVGFAVEKGQTTFLIGRSGCGKSTLLRCMNGLEGFERGKIRVGKVEIERGAGRVPTEEQVHELRDHTGMVFQTFHLFPHLTVLENATLALRVVKRLGPADAEAIAIPLLEKVGLKAQLLRYPSQISGGQQQRAAIARALAMSPDVMLYDEPTSALDTWLVDEVREVMQKLDADGMTQIVVTHELALAREAADQILFMEEGTIVESGTAEKVLRSPEDPRTQAFVRKFR